MHLQGPAGSTRPPASVHAACRSAADFWSLGRRRSRKRSPANPLISRRAGPAGSAPQAQPSPATHMPVDVTGQRRGTVLERRTRRPPAWRRRPGFFQRGRRDRRGFRRVQVQPGPVRSALGLPAALPLQAAWQAEAPRPGGRGRHLPGRQILRWAGRCCHAPAHCARPVPGSGGAGGRRPPARRQVS